MKLLHKKESKIGVVKALLPENPSEEDIKRKINVINKVLEHIRRINRLNWKKVNCINNYIGKGFFSKRRLMRKWLGFPIPK